MMRLLDISLQLASAIAIVMLSWAPKHRITWGTRLAYIALFVAISLFAWHSPSRANTEKALIQKTAIQNVASRDTQEVAIPPNSDASAELYTNIPWIMAQARKGQWNFSQTVWVRGAVAHHAALDHHGMLLLTRPFMVCCAADIQTFAILMPVPHPERYTDGQWLTVQGRVEKVLDTLKRRAPWERRAQTLYARDLHLRADSIIVVDIDVPDPYVYYQLDGSFADF